MTSARGRSGGRSRASRVHRTDLVQRSQRENQSAAQVAASRSVPCSSKKWPAPATTVSSATAVPSCARACSFRRNTSESYSPTIRSVGHVRGDPDALPRTLDACLEMVEELRGISEQRERVGGRHRLFSSLHELGRTFQEMIRYFSPREPLQLAASRGGDPLCGPRVRLRNASGCAAHNASSRVSAQSLRGCACRPRPGQPVDTAV